MQLSLFVSTVKSILSAPLKLTHIITFTFILIIALAGFIFHKNKQTISALDQIIEENLLATKKMQLYSNLTSHIRSRTNLASQILVTDDVFLQDELKLEFDNYAARFNQTFAHLTRSPLDSYEKEFLRQQEIYINETLPLLLRAISLSMDGSAENRRNAATIFYDIVIPAQNTLISVFQKMINSHKKNIENKVAASHNKLHDAIYNDHIIALIATILVTLISMLAIRLTHSVQSNLYSYQQSLEYKVQQRTSELAHARELAEHANQIRYDFLSSMSHDLRTPLNAIIGFSQILAHNDRLDDQQRNHIKEIIHSGQHLLGFINDILDLASIEAGKNRLSLEKITVAEILDECITLVSSEAKRYQVQLLREKFSSYVVTADRVRLKQVILNLVTNAIKYNHHGGSIKIDMQPVASKKLRITIIDTGIGIPKERQHDLFLPFNRLNGERGDIEGNGIGLAITRRLVEEMGGEIGFESMDKIGSRFWVVLPLVRAPKHATTAEEAVTVSRTGTSN